LDLKTAFVTNPISVTLPVALSHKKQLYISETEKFAHVTYFINGGYPGVVGGEDRIMIQSPKVRSYAEKPEMSSRDITDVIAGNLKHGIYDVIVVNYPNSDMVAHTGDFAATVKGIETVDKCLKELYKIIERQNGILLLTADHGNADVMFNKKDGKVFTFHTKNPVPFVVVSPQQRIKKMKLKEGILGNISPTLLKLLDFFDKPKEMTEESLIRE
jgi:2,3-bisphosphoglycerate-independent phosphoglycerate mutase